MRSRVMLAVRSSAVSAASPGAVRSILAMGTASIAGVVHAGRTLCMMTFIILASKSGREKPEAGSLA